ncbi:DUF736 family protein [Sphingobium sp. CFD-1]|uniref:DUF736 family protein n=1 Tax=Sphingobium sp. CFD-1 TaxID=2878545 RepID=UPI00214C4F23|nr:DUF736 family protein [Sphingobium sp. CFD-1]
MQKSDLRLIVSRTAVLVAMIEAPSAVLAQSQPRPSSLSSPSETAAENVSRDEIIVTARKRNESFQSVPVAVAGFSAEALRQKTKGGWDGDIDTLPVQKRRIRLVPNDNRESDETPAFRVMPGWNPIGDAWEKKSRSDPARDYVRVEIDDPFYPLKAILLPDAEGMTAQMVLPFTYPPAVRSNMAG